MGLECVLRGALQYSCRQAQAGVYQTARRRADVAHVSPGSWVAASAPYRGKLTPPGRGFSTQPPRDVALFEHDRTRFFRLLSLFCGGQLVFWTSLAHFAFTGLRDTSARPAGDGAAAPRPATTTTMGLAGIGSFEVNLGSAAWRYGFTVGCLAVGAGIVGLAALFCRRSVSQVVLHRGGRTVTVRTQSPLGPGRGRAITVPLAQVACHAHRQESPSFIPLRVKGHKFYFLLDKEGTVNNTRLFDTTVGAYRPV
ncbi:transmembrane protein 223 [Cololabis saira]|uniref:transmembrane protein 223 n=1 Tax=Cololabis saira TaxID=129043 RepID=UPI002AD3642F|nr:transmembrane protein 223 [Cololabis saira]